MYKKLLPAAMLVLFASSSFAAAPGTYYGGLDAGSSTLDRVNDRATSFGGFIGYNISPHWAAEGAVRHLGKWDVFGGDLTASQASLSLVGTLPISAGFDFFGRIGVNHLNVDSNSRFTTLGNGNFTGGNFALGLAYHFTPVVAGRIEFQQAANDLSNISAGIVVSF